MNKKLLSILLATLMLILVPLSVSAETAVQPRYTYTGSHHTTLLISNDIATVESYLNGYSSVTSIRMTLTLQKKVLWWWDDVVEWNDIVPNSAITMSESTTVGSGTYRVKMVAVVCSGTNSETVEGYSGEKTN